MSGRVKTASWGLAVYAGTRVLAGVLESASLASAVAQAVLAEWGTGRLGVTWSDPDVYRDPPTASEMAKRALRGAAFGVVPAAAVIALLVATRGVLLERSAATAASLGIVIVGAAVTAMRDELVLHGVVIRMMQGEARGWAKALACGITSAAAAIGDRNAARAVAVQGLLGIVFGALWTRDKGAWMAWGAHTAWLVATSLVFGGIWSATNASSSWGGGNAGPLGSDAAILALVPFAVATLFLERRTT